MTSQLFIVSGPSGVGKTSLLKSALQGLARIRVVVSHTTRSLRRGDCDGVDYHFVTPDEFARLKRCGAFLETATVFGNEYATSRAAVEQVFDAGCNAAVLEIDQNGAAQIRRAQMSSLSVFILPPSMGALRSRLEQRDQDNDATAIAQRNAEAFSEMRHWREFDFVVVNDDFNRASTALRRIFSGQSLDDDMQAQARQTITGLSL